MSDAELREFAMAQLSCLNDYRQQLILRRHQLSKLTYERTEREKQIASGEKMLQERQERLSSKKKRLANLQILKEEAQMKMSAAAALGKLLEHFLFFFTLLLQVYFFPQCLSQGKIIFRPCTTFAQKYHQIHLHFF